MRLIVLTLVLALAGCSPASPEIDVIDAWARATAPGQSNGAVYAIIANYGAADRLIGASTPVGSAMIHGNEHKAGVARMRTMSELPIAAGSRVTLAPGATHVMLTGLTAPLTAGTHIPLTLRFAEGGPRTVAVAVVAAGSR